jgi:DNA-binding CsgD family transcriptional regulator
VQTSVPDRLMNDYIGEKLYLDDPWIAHSAASTAWDALDIEQGQPSALSARCRRLQTVFADHGLRTVCLVPAYGGQRPGALVLYATGRDEARALRDPDHLKRLRLLTAIAAAHWRPEMEGQDPEGSQIGAYRFSPVLSPREAEVLSWLAQGLDGAGIAHRMGIAQVTVAKHLRTVRLKLGAQTREQALAVAIRDGLISP